MGEDGRCEVKFDLKFGFAWVSEVRVGAQHWLAWPGGMVVPLAWPRTLQVGEHESVGRGWVWGRGR